MLAFPVLVLAAAVLTESVQPSASPTGLDSVVVEKGARRLRAWRGGRVVQESRVALGPSPRGDKLCEGDGRTPEGRYAVSFRNPDSRYHRSLRLSYPSAQDRRESREAGCAPGGDVMIHGLPPAWSRWGARALMADWTLGCVSLTDEGIDSLWAAAKVGTPVVIRP